MLSCYFFHWALKQQHIDNFIEQIAEYSNLSMQVIYVVTFQLNILCLKIGKFYILKHFESQNITRIMKTFRRKLLICTCKNSVSRITLIIFL